MDERNDLNEEKWKIANDVAEKLSVVMPKIVKWQVYTRGVSPEPAYNEAVGELKKLLEDVEHTVLNSMILAYHETRRGE